MLVDEQMRTSVPSIYAVGDIASPEAGSLPSAMWSHKANAEGIVAAENAMGKSSRMDYDPVPRCLYTWPEVAWVGLTEEQAEAQGIEVSVGKVPIAINPYAMILDETAGMVKIIASSKYGKILGAHIMAPGAVDLDQRRQRRHAVRSHRRRADALDPGAPGHRRGIGRCGHGCGETFAAPARLVGNGTEL